jgi:hypothetical protein
MLAAQAMRDRAREPAKHLVAGVDNVPIPLYVLCFGGIGFHHKNSREEFGKCPLGSSL